MFIDSHCHLDRLDLSPYNNDFDAMISAAHERDISKMLCVSIDLEQFEGMYDLIEKQPTILASMGVHPLHVEKESDISGIDFLVNKAKQHEKVIAIGETGLDYYYQTETKDWQHESFINHLKAAKELSLPVIVHTRDAREDTISLIDAHGGSDAGVLHCFTESTEMALQGIELGYYVSFSGIITFKNAAELREVVKAVPLERILIETDAPYLAPVPHRGKKNEPKYVIEVAQCVADLKGVRIEEVAEQTSANFHNLFKKAADF